MNKHQLKLLLEAPLFNSTFKEWFAGALEQSFFTEKYWNGDSDWSWHVAEAMGCVRGEEGNEQVDWPKFERTYKEFIKELLNV